MFLTPITLFYASLLSFVYVTLLLLVVRLRHQYKIAYGDGDNAPLRSRIRAHANFAEYVPMLLIFLLLGELNGLPASAIHGFGSTIVGARMAHAYGHIIGEHTKPPSYKGRFYGTLVTLLLYFTACLSALALAMVSFFADKSL